MSSPSYSWPEELFPSEAVRSWLGSELDSDIVGPTRVVYAKPWGVTAEFLDTGVERRVIFKGSRHPATAHGPVVHRFLGETVPGSVPAAYAARVDGDTAWTVFEAVDGESLEQHLDQDRFAQLAAVFAAIQAAVSEAPIPASIPRSPLRSLPATLDRFAGSAEAHRSEWESGGPRPQAASPRDAAMVLRSLRPRVSAAVEELSDAAWPDSIDHVDLNVSNVLVRDGRMVFIDWEEAVIGFPACSLDRLLGDASEHDEWSDPGISPTGEALIGAYADAVPWGEAALRRRIVETAVRVNRVAFAGQILDFWQALGRPHGPPGLAAFCTDRIIDAWSEDGR